MLRYLTHSLSRRNNFRNKFSETNLDPSISICKFEVYINFIYRGCPNPQSYLPIVHQTFIKTQQRKLGFPSQFIEKRIRQTFLIVSETNVKTCSCSKRTNQTELIYFHGFLFRGAGCCLNGFAISTGPSQCFRASLIRSTWPLLTSSCFTLRFIIWGSKATYLPWLKLIYSV